MTRSKQHKPQPCQPGKIQTARKQTTVAKRLETKKSASKTKNSQYTIVKRYRPGWYIIF